MASGVRLSLRWSARFNVVRCHFRQLSRGSGTSTVRIPDSPGLATTMKAAFHCGCVRAEKSEQPASTSKGHGYTDDADVLESEDDEPSSHIDGKELVTEVRLNRELGYYYNIAGVRRANFDVMVNKGEGANKDSPKAEQDIRDIYRRFEEAPTEMERSWTSLLKLLQRLASDGLKLESLFSLLPILNKLPNRWNSLAIMIDRRTIEAISSQIYYAIASSLANGRTFSRMSNDQLIAVLNTFSNFYVRQFSTSRLLISRLLHFISERCGELSNDQLIYLLFSIGLYRMMPKQAAVNLENELIKRYSSLTVQQLCLAAFSFYRTDTQFDGRRLLDILIQQTLRSMKTEEDDLNFCLMTMMKALKLNGSYEHAYVMPQLTRRLIEKPLRAYSFYYWSHFASACRRMNYYDPVLSEKMLDKATSEFDTLRLKDTVLILNYLSEMNHPLREDISTMFINRLRREWDYCYSHLPVRALFGLSIRDIYPVDLISKVLCKDYLLNFASGRTSMEKLPARALFWLDCSVAIERPDYVGQRLDISLFKNPDIVDLLANTLPVQCDKSLPSLNVHLAQLSVAEHMVHLSTGCDSKCIFRGLILPHSPLPGLLLKLKNGQPIRLNVDQSLRRIELQDVKPPLDEQWVAILTKSQGSCKFRSAQFLGHHAAHQRQLEKLGYKVLIVHHKALPKRPTDAAVKRFEQFFQSLRDNPSVSSFVY